MAKIKESFIECGYCGTKFHSPIFFADTESFKRAATAGNVAQCPKCSEMVDCNEGSMSYVLEGASDRSGSSSTR